MLAIIVVCALTVLALAPALAGAQGPAPQGEAEALRRELDQMRRQFEMAQQEYRKAMEAMTERLQRLEAKPQTAAVQPVVAQVPPASPQPTVLDYLAPRTPFALSERTGRGQLLFDIGLTADFIAAFSTRKVDLADAGTFTGRENRFFPREIEVAFFGQIDPYARGEVIIEAAEEFEDGERELHLGLAEAHLTLLALPGGTQAKLGLMRSRFGLLNQLHAHALPQPDRPNVLVNFFGDEGLVESGIEFTWVPPTPFYLELLLGIFNGDNEDAFGNANLRNPLVTGRARTFFELTDTSALQLGASGAYGRTEDSRAQSFAGVDVKFKHTPESWRHPLLTVGAESIWSFREDVDTRWGMYAWLELQPWRQWAGGVRVDRSAYLEASGREWAVEPYVVYMPSDFLRFRAAYKYSDRSNRGMFTMNGHDGSIAHELFLQATFILGAHPAHPF